MKTAIRYILLFALVLVSSFKNGAYLVSAATYTDVPTEHWADEVIQPELDVAERLSRRLSLSNITDIFEFRGSAIADVSVPRHICGKPLKELDLRNKYNITILLMRKAGSIQEYAFGPNTVLEAGDQLTVFGNENAIIELFKER